MRLVITSPQIRRRYVLPWRHVSARQPADLTTAFAQESRRAARHGPASDSARLRTAGRWISLRVKRPSPIRTEIYVRRSLWPTEHFQHDGSATSCRDDDVALDVVVAGPHTDTCGSSWATWVPRRNRQETVASGGNQRGRCRKPGVSNVSRTNQRFGESIDTVGVTGSIPVSPTRLNEAERACSFGPSE
jgi:hypothetical protein